MASDRREFGRSDLLLTVYIPAALLAFGQGLGAQVKKQQKDGGVSLDDEKKFSDQIQKATDATIAEIDQLLAHKEAEITQV